MLGATDDDLAGPFEVEPATIADRIAGFRDFSAALRQGREIAGATPRNINAYLRQWAARAVKT
jgi:hypothetical protein